LHRKLPGGLRVGHQRSEPLAIAADHRAHPRLGRRADRALQFVIQDARHPRVARNERDMREEHALERLQRRAAGGEGRADRVAERLAHPVEDRRPDRVLVGEVAKQRAVRDPDPLGDRLRGDALRPGLAGQIDDREHDFALPLGAAQPPARPRYRVRRMSLFAACHYRQVSRLLLSIEARFRSHKAPP